MSTPHRRLRPGVRIRLVDQKPRTDRPWTGFVEGTLVQFEPAPIAALLGHGRDPAVRVDRLVLRTDEGEVLGCVVDAWTRIEFPRRRSRR